MTIWIRAHREDSTGKWHLEDPGANPRAALCGTTLPGGGGVDRGRDPAFTDRCVECHAVWRRGMINLHD